MIMDMTLIKELARVTQTSPHGTPVRPVLMALAKLLGPEPTVPELVCTHGWLDGEGVGQTMNWQVAALTERSIIEVAASRKSNSSSWALGYGDQRADRLSAWSAPIGSVARVEVKNLDMLGTTRMSDEPWAADLTYHVVLTDGNRITLPAPQSSDPESVDQFVMELLRRM